MFEYYDEISYSKPYVYESVKGFIAVCWPLEPVTIYGVRHMFGVKKTPEQIHYNMSRIRGKDTEIEMNLRKELWSRGLRYRKNAKSILGKPDVAFIGKKVAVFCDSEFWHGYDWENRREEIKSNRDYWIPKIERNIARDLEVNEGLEADGWIVLRYWGENLKKNLSAIADEIEKVVKNR